MLNARRYPKTRPRGRVFAARGRAAGYTIVELVVVMVLLGILAANAMPRFVSASRFEEMGFADASATALRYARKLAKSSGCDTLFRIDDTGYALTQRASACDSGALTRAIIRPGGGAWRDALPAGVSVTSLSVYFDGSGRPVDASSSSLLTATRSFSVGTRLVTVHPETGFVQVQ